MGRIILWLVELIKLLALMVFLFKSIGVEFAEMASPPIIQVNDDKLFIQVSNSTFHSSKVITKLEFYCEPGVILIKGWQKTASIKKYDGRFVENLSSLDLSPEMAINSKFFWVNTDGSRTEITLKKRG